MNRHSLDVLTELVTAVCCKYICHHVSIIILSVNGFNPKFMKPNVRCKYFVRGLAKKCSERIGLFAFEHILAGKGNSNVNTGYRFDYGKGVCL